VPPCEHVGSHLRIRVPDVGHVVDVEDGSCQIKGIATGHGDNLTGALQIVACGRGPRYRTAPCNEDAGGSRAPNNRMATY
jgi:hypothetical protein